MRLKHLEALKRTKLTPIERTGDPEAISTELLSLNSTRRRKKLDSPRASGIYKDCMRNFVVCKLYDIPAYDTVTFARQLTFDIGNAIHYWLQNSKSYFGDQRRGYWGCAACGRVTLFGKPRVTACPCGADWKAYVYEEAHLQIVHPYSLSGHPDLFLEPVHSPGSARIVEFKTINGESFARLKAPLIDHVWQVNSYMWMCDEDPTLISGHIDTGLAYIMYISKKEKYGELPIKTFLVKKEPYIIDGIKKKLKEFHEGITTGVLPSCLDVCLNTQWTHPTSKYCPARDKCKRLHENNA